MANKDTEITRLKKEVFNLNQQLSDYKEEIQEKIRRIGLLENENNKMKNETVLVNRTNLMNTKEIIKEEVERKLEEEKQRMIHLEKNFEEAQKLIQILEIEKRNFLASQTEIQRENQQLKKQLAEFGLKHGVSDYITDIHEQRLKIASKDREYQELVLNHNKLCDQMEDILAENRLLRELANVPKNFGINIEELKLGDRKKIEDYEAKNRILMKRIDELEIERAQLNSSRLFLASAIQTREQPFTLLSTEQKLVVAQYAQALYEGKDFIIPERYELLKENEKLKAEIKALEKQLQGIQMESLYKIYNITDKNKILQTGTTQLPQVPVNTNNEAKELIEILKTENEKLMKMLNNSLSHLDKFKDFNMENFKNMTMQSQHKGDEREMSYLQLPPKPIIEKGDVDHINTGFSYRFNSKIKIDPNQMHALYSIANNDLDIDALKEESAALQLQMIETLEIIDRMKSQDEFLNNNLSKLYNRYEDLVMVQTELFERYIRDKSAFQKDKEELTKKNKDLRDEVSDFVRKNKALEDTIKLIESGNVSAIEIRALEKMKENSILDMNLIKLKRKYECLWEDNQKINKYLEDTEKNSAEKDKQMEEAIIKLKEWKTILLFYLKHLTKKLKDSVSKGEYDRLTFENNFLREKQKEMLQRDIQMSKKVSNVDSLNVRMHELEQELLFSEESRLDSEIELNFFKRKLEDLDPNFQAQEGVMRKFVIMLNELSLSFAEIKHIFDPDNSGKTDRKNFISAIKTLKIKLDEKEIDMIINNIIKDSEKRIDIEYFLRKLSRYGIEEEKEDEQVILKFFEAIQKSNISLVDVFQMFDKDGNGKISRHEFKFALQNIQKKTKISDETIDKVLYLVCSDNEFEELNYEQFCELINSKSKKVKNKMLRNDQISGHLKIDKKTTILNKLIEAIERNNLTFEQAFNFIDADKQGEIEFEELRAFLKKISSSISEKEINEIYLIFDKNADGSISINEFKMGLKECQNKVKLFNQMTFQDSAYDYEVNEDLGEGTLELGKGVSRLGVSKEALTQKEVLQLKHKLVLLSEREKFFEHKINNYKINTERLEKQNKELTKQHEEYYTKHMAVADMYFKKSEELSDLKTIYSTSLTKNECRKIEGENDSLSREVTILRSGLNTFKDLYKSSTRQINSLNIKLNKGNDEVDTYKKIIKDLQAEGNQQALIGKLYYSLIISRWREAEAIKKQDDFLSEFAKLREENYQIETENKNLLKQATEYENDLHEKIIENVRLHDENNQITTPIISSEQLDELRNMVKELLQEKNDITEKYVVLAKENLRHLNTIEEMRGKVDYSEQLAIRLKIDNNSDAHRKIIELSDLLAKAKLSESMMSREHAFSKEQQNYLERIVEFNNGQIRKLETSNAELEAKCHKIELHFKNKDEERQKKFFQQLEGLKMYDLKFFADKKNQGSLSDKDNVITMHKEIEMQKKEIKEYEHRMKQYQETLLAKTNEINRLNTIITEYSQGTGYIYPNSYNEGNQITFNPNLNTLTQSQAMHGEQIPTNSHGNPQVLNQKQLDLINEDETRKFAQTAHKTIKTLQELLTIKNQQIDRKDKMIEDLKNDNIKSKELHMNKIQRLEEQINLENVNTMKKLNSVLENINPGIVVNLSQNALSLMTLADIQKLIDEKDSTIKLMAVELQNRKDALDFHFMKINDLNKKIIELNAELEDNETKRGTKIYLEEIKKLKMIIQEKTDLIDMEKEHIKKLREDYQTRLAERIEIEEQMLKNSVHVPDRKIENEIRVEYFGKIQEERNRNKKLQNEIKKLNTTIEDLNKKIAEQEKIIADLKNTNKLYFITQDKDTQIIKKLKDDKEKQKEQIDQLKEELKRGGGGGVSMAVTAPIVFQPKVVDVSETETKTSVTGPKAKQRSSTNTSATAPTSAVPKTSSASKFGFKKDSGKDLTKPKPTEEIKSDKASDESAQEVMKRLIYFCMNKNINMLKHLQRYDLTKLGKLNKSNFAKAVDELKLGLIDSDIVKLLDWMKITENYVEIGYFVDLMIKTEPNYTHYIKDQDYLYEDKHTAKKASKKYEPFERKDFNIKY